MLLENLNKEDFYSCYDGKKTTVKVSSGDFSGTGVALVHPDDEDLSTEKTGEYIAYMRAVMDLIDNYLSKPQKQTEKNELVEAKAQIKQELQAFIDYKDKMYKRVRKMRTDKNYRKTEIYAISKDGQVAVKIEEE